MRQHINSVPVWNKTSLIKYSEYVSISSLVELVKPQNQSIITSDGSKIKTKSVEAWIIADSQDNCLVKGSNLEFGSMNMINSNRSELFRILTVLLFFDEYCRFFMRQIQYGSGSKDNTITG